MTRDFILPLERVGKPSRVRNVLLVLVPIATLLMTGMAAAWLVIGCGLTRCLSP